MPEKRASKRAFVYVVETDDRAVKIGVSTNPKRRKGGLDVGSHIGSRLHSQHATDHPYSVERAAHHLLDDYLIRGEWYRCSGATAAAVVSALIEGDAAAALEAARLWGAYIQTLEQASATMSTREQRQQRTDLVAFMAEKGRLSGRFLQDAEYYLGARSAARGGHPVNQPETS